MSILIYNRRKLPLLKFRTLGLVDLPDEIISIIADHLNYRDYKNFQRVCKRFSKIKQTPSHFKLFIPPVRWFTSDPRHAFSTRIKDIYTLHIRFIREDEHLHQIFHT